MVGAVSESAALWHLLGQWFHGIFLKSCQRTSHQPQAVLLEWENFGKPFCTCVLISLPCFKYIGRLAPCTCELKRGDGGLHWMAGNRCCRDLWEIQPQAIQLDISDSHLLPVSPSVCHFPNHGRLTHPVSRDGRGGRGLHESAAFAVSRRPPACPALGILAGTF